MADAETIFLKKLAGLIPGAAGYREAAGRAQTDLQVREHIASELERLSGRINELKASAEEEGEEDMAFELGRIDERMARTIAAVRGADYAGVPFFTAAALDPKHLARACAYDTALMEDLDLLASDVMSMKYETIGNLTLREAEGTLAAIELKITNRKDVFETSGED